MKPIVCHDCKRTLQEGDEYMDYKNGFYKCRPCHEKDPILRNYQKTEVYTRVVGYMRPTDQLNPGKAAEYNDRKNFVI